MLRCVVLMSLCACDVPSLDPTGPAGNPIPSWSDDTSEPGADPTSPGDTGTTDDEPPPGSSWDRDPPDGLPGTQVVARVACALLSEDTTITLTRSEDPWLWKYEPTDGGGLSIPGLEPCYESTSSGQGSVAVWEHDRLTLVSGTMIHSLVGSGVEDLWVGTVLPLSGTTLECDAAMVELGIEWPATIALTVTEVIPPPE